MEEPRRFFPYDWLQKLREEEKRGGGKGEIYNDHAFHHNVDSCVTSIVKWERNPY